MSNTKSLMLTMGDRTQEAVFRQLVDDNETRIMNDPMLPELQNNLKGMNELVKERSKQNILTYSQFLPYLELFGREDVKGLSPEVRIERRKLLAHYYKNVINPQEITIILSDDRKWVVGVHDVIFRKVQSANPGQETLRINATMEIQQQRKNQQAAGMAAMDLGAEVITANDAANNSPMVVKSTMDSVLVRVIQDRIIKAQEMGLPGTPYELPGKAVHALIDASGEETEGGVETPHEQTGYDDDTTTLS